MNLFKLFEMSSIDFKSFFELLFRFALNTITLVIIVRYLYYPVTRRKDYLFTFLLLGTVIFLFCYLLASVQLQLGFALGVFAVFRLIRFRTDQISVKEMTYLAIVISISVINALFNDSVKAIELLFTNAAVVALIYGFERFWLVNTENSKIVIYEKIDLIKPENHELLMEDLKKRTGVNITRIEIGRMDFLRDSTVIKIYFMESGRPGHFTSVDDKWKSGEDF